MNALAAARNHHKAVKEEKLNAKVKAKEVKKGKFGDNALDHMRAGKHDFRHPDSCRDGHQPCSFCRMVNQQAETFFAYEGLKSFRSKQEGMMKRAELRVGLLQGWARNQATFYEDSLPTSFKTYFISEIVFSENLVDSLVKHTEFLELIEGKETLWGFKNSNDDDVDLGNGNGTGAGDGDGDGDDSIININNNNQFTGPIDMIEIQKTLSRRTRILEVGKYAATFIQSRIRKVCARKRIRLYATRRFEYHEGGQEKSDYILDRETGISVKEQPALIEDIFLKTPRTMNRRANAIERKREERLKNYRKYIQNFINPDTNHYYDLFQIEEDRMERMRNFTIARDIFAMSMATITRQVREHRADLAGQNLEEESEEESEDDDNNNDDESKSQLANGSIDNGSIANGSLASLSLDASNIFTAEYEPCYLTMAAPSPAARELGITFSLATDTVLKKTPGYVGTGPEITAQELNSLMIALETKAWKMLQIKKPDEILSRFLNDNIHPPLQSCVAIADDDQNIWKGDSKIKFEGKLKHDYKLISKKAKEAQSEKAKLEEQTKENRNKGHVLPMAVQLRPILNPTLLPKDIYRLFFVDGELCGVTCYSPWAYYADSYRLRDLLLQAIKEFALSPDITAFIHSYSNRANKSLLKACGVLNKQGNIDFDLLDTNYEFEDSTDNSNTIGGTNKLDSERRRVSSILSLGGRKNSTLPDSRRISGLGNMGLGLDASRKQSILGTSPAPDGRKQSVMGVGSMGGPNNDRNQSVLIPKKASAQFEKQLLDEKLKSRNMARCTALYTPPEFFLFDIGKYIDTIKLSSLELVEAVKRYSFLKKVSALKPLLVKAQNEVFRLAGKKKDNNDNNNNEMNQNLAQFNVRQLHSTRLKVLNDMPEPENLYGTHIQRLTMIDVPNGLPDTDVNMQKYFDELGQMSIHTEVAMIDRILRPKLQDLGAPPEYKGFSDSGKSSSKDGKKLSGSGGEETKDSEIKKDERELQKEKEDAEFEKRQAEINHSLNLELAPQNLVVIECNIANNGAITKRKKDKNKSKGGPSKNPKVDPAAAAEAEAPPARLKMELFNVVGIFSCDREINERPPPAVDCGLIEWEHLLQMNDIAEYEKEIHPLQWLTRPITKDYFLPLERGQRPWSHPDHTGLITHTIKLKSKKTFKMNIIGTPPDKEHLNSVIPRNIKTWLNM